MKELDQDIKARIEVSVKQKRQVEYELIGKIIPHEGHVIWQINKQTLSIERAKFSNATYIFGSENKKEIIIKDGYAYISALNKKNALKKYKQQKNGSKEVDKNPLTL